MTGQRTEASDTAQGADMRGQRPVDAREADALATVRLLLERGVVAFQREPDASSDGPARQPRGHRIPGSPNIDASDWEVLVSRVHESEFTRSREVAANLIVAASALPPASQTALAALDAAETTALTHLLRSFVESRREAENPLTEYAGPWADTAAVQHHLGGISRQAVHKRVSAQKLLACKFRDGALYYPTRQFTAHGVVAGLPEVLTVLATGTDSPQTWAAWLAGPMEPGADGSRTWWDALADGDVEAVVSEARRDASRWAA